MTPFIHSYTVDIRSGMRCERAKQPVGHGDALADCFVVTMVDGHEAIDLAGVGVSALVIRPDGATVTLKGEVKDGSARVTLDDMCYDIPGNITVTVLLMSGEIKQSVLRVSMNVTTGETDIIAETEVLNVADVLAAAERAEAAAERAEAAGGGGVKTVNSFHPDENGEVTIKYAADTDLAYQHSGLSDGQKKITVYASDDYSNSPKIMFGENYWPTTRHKKSKDKLLFSDGNNITVKGSNTTQLQVNLIPYEGADEYWPVPEDFIPGEKLSLHVYGKPAEGVFPTAKLEMYDSNKTFVKQLPVKIPSGEIYATYSTTFPEGVAYVRYAVTIVANVDYNHTFFPVLVKASTEIADIAFENGVAVLETSNQTTEICTAPHESVVNCNVELKEYIDRKASQKQEDDPFKGGILTPEMFGAYADGFYDDTEAVQACIDSAIAEGKKVIGGGNYITSLPLKIAGANGSFDIKQITYSGDDCAVVVSGQNNNISIGTIYANSGAGFRLNSGAGGAANEYNEIYLGKVIAGKNAVEYISSGYNLVSNNMTFGHLRGGKQYHCIYHSPFQQQLDGGMNHGNNNFVGGLLESAKWGVYNARHQDAYITCRFEGVTNCIHQGSGGMVRVICPRYVEIVVQTTKDGSGIFYEVSGMPYEVLPRDVAQSPFHYFTLDGGSGPLNTYSINVSEMPTRRISADGVSVEPVSKMIPGANIINERLRTFAGTTIANSFMIFANHILVHEPALAMTKHVAATDGGYAGDYRTTGVDDEFFIYDTYVVDESGCVYTLPPSYDAIAFNHFKIIQPEGTSCTFKDWRGTVVFNGAEYGAGTYDVRITTDSPLQLGDYDNNRQIWEIRRMSDYSLVDTMPHEATV